MSRDSVGHAQQRGPPQGSQTGVRPRERDPGSLALPGMLSGELVVQVRSSVVLVIPAAPHIALVA